jgi:FAD/FMN-containing dehydrogenase
VKPLLGLGSFERSIDGYVITPDDSRYRRAVAVFNGRIAATPALIVRCRTEGDIVATLGLASDAGIPISIRAGGHSIQGDSVRNGSIVIDLRDLTEVSCDPERRLAEVQGGALLGDLDRASSQFGLATTMGIVSSTGVAGLTLGGGLGWLMGRFGLACDNLVGTRTVLPSGEVVQVDDEVNPDLAWAMRGAGASFGVSISLTFRLHEVRDVLAGSLVFSLDSARTIFAGLDAIRTIMPIGITISPSFVFSRGTPVISLDLCAIDPSDSASIEVIQELRQTRGLLKDTVRRRPYAAWQSHFDESARDGLRAHWRNLNVDELASDAVEAIAVAFAQAPSEASMISFDHMHGEAARSRENSCVLRKDQLVMLVNANWRSASEDVANVDWCNSLAGKLAELGANGMTYANYDGEREWRRDSRVYGDGVARLRELRRRYDPDHLLTARFNDPPGSAGK